MLVHQFALILDFTIYKMLRASLKLTWDMSVYGFKGERGKGKKLQTKGVELRLQKRVQTFTLKLSG